MARCYTHCGETEEVDRKRSPLKFVSTPLCWWLDSRVDSPIHPFSVGERYKMAYANSASFLSGGYHLLTARSSSSSSSDHDYSKESRSASLEDGLCESGAVGSTTSPRQWPWRVWFRRALRELSPSFFHPWIRRKQYGSKGPEPECEPRPISPTAWLGQFTTNHTNSSCVQIGHDH